METKDQKRWKTTRTSEKLTTSVPSMKTVHVPARRVVERAIIFECMQGESRKIQ
jgi:hypothetical protein